MVDQGDMPWCPLPSSLALNVLVSLLRPCVFEKFSVFTQTNFCLFLVYQTKAFSLVDGFLQQSSQI